ncbi:MAG: ABC transporter permease [Chloroflexota bacterium]|nr:MAG: ABC transporter permease [Chloroflexota bacterium]
MVSVARRNLFHEKTRLLISTGGVAFALLLVLALDGLVAGSLAQITAYISNTGAEVYVAQSGVRTMHMSASALPLSTADEIRGVAGVERVEPILYAANAVVAGDNRSLAYIIGFDSASGRAGPWRMASGSATLEPGEVVLDSAAAEKLGVGLRDEVVMLGRPFRIKGLSAETANFVNSVAFVRLDDFAALRGQAGTASYLLVWLADGVSPREGVERIKTNVPDIEVMTRAQFAGEEGRVVRDMTAEIMVIMNGIGFLIGLAAAGLTIYTATLAKIREYGVLKALGARETWLYHVVVEQAFWSVGLGAAMSVVLALTLSSLFALMLPSVPIRIEPGSLAKAFIGAGVISVIAAVLPIFQVARLDPVAVFRR